ncbi:DUF4126 domain-containing protein [Kovacikia minuta CCNUW1]|uniref:DUF4126 domain-containing protein n=1 Tax=Kovacikia minuta TaxID=2931930 RepID=UPI001CCEC206|nr:DUF4126 domain-containing protein [Kovacikia minuta]UBF27663.1 DUF4126 domain-containing protein [Kovacikia minuta CCNUW1]
METIISLCIGLALSAAAGFRLLVPFLALSVAAIFGHFPVSPDLQWVGTYPAMEAFAIAVLAETLLYYIPWLDHLMDMVALPASMIAGTLITASFATHLDPFLQWSLAIIAGGGAAAAVKGLTGASRLTSTLTTGGIGNFIVTTLELVGAIVVSVLAIALPKLAIVLIPMLVIVVIGQGARHWWKHRQSLQPSTGN